MTGQNPFFQAPAAAVLDGIEATNDEFLAVVHALIDEIRIAIGAIEGNELASLTASIQRQEELCLALVMPTSAAAIPPWQTLRPAESRHPVEDRIDSAWETLRGTGVEYALLLESSSRSIELLSALCRGCSGDVKPVFAHTKAGHGSSNNSTWSCEV